MQDLLRPEGRLRRLGAQIACALKAMEATAWWPGLIETMDHSGFEHQKPRLVLTGITKRYPSVVANDGVSLSVRPGEIHAVLGENGAGKSTLMKIIYGVTKPDAGTILWNDQYEIIAAPPRRGAWALAWCSSIFRCSRH
jgi:ABC-type glutathione transport system ATPase component